MAKAKKPTKKELDKIQGFVNDATKQALEEQKEGIHKDTMRMFELLNKLDQFLDKLVQEEKVDPVTITEMLMIKARHTAFCHTEDTDPSRTCVWLINIILFNANAVFGVSKAHLLAQKEKGSQG